MKILVRNLSRSTTESDLRLLFEAYGTLQSCTLVMDAQEARSKGFGFIEMPKAGEAKAAIRSLNGTEVDGRAIRVKKAEAVPASQVVSEKDRTPATRDVNTDV